MAWFDYLGGIGQGIEQASRTGLAAVKERQQEEAARVEQELARLDPMQPLTADQVKRYGKYVGAGSFTRTPEGQFLLKQTPQQEVAGYQLQKARDVQAAEKEWERLTTPDTSGKIPLHGQPLEKVLALGRKAGVNVLESGALSPTQVEQSLKQVGSVVAKMQQLESAQEAKIRELELKSASDKEINAAKAEAAALRYQAEQTTQIYRMLMQQQFQREQAETGRTFTAEQNWQNRVSRLMSGNLMSREDAEAAAGPRPGAAPMGTNPYR